MPVLDIRPLSREETAFVYNEYLRADFADDERKPLSAILRSLDAGCYLCLGAFSGGQLLAYAFFIFNQSPAGRNYLLDYFAVLESHRAHGVGSRFLQALPRHLSDPALLIIEVENPDFAADAVEKVLRERRIAFYRKNGAVDTGIAFWFFDVEYLLMGIPMQGTAWTPDQIRDAYTAILRSVIPPRVLRENQRFHESSAKNKEL